ncbi:DUF4352 domain-containing protein [Actinomyces sp. ZJ308]|uniref:DUF4352 domain-containing protein n=1 Tax=Actinomyces sp. ZJ308 TaxID=2708342 RepID=UPI001FBBA7B2|nr:DUF4352 domain-containing protein [Actinomyces sp. ZJ308]
MSMQQAPVPVKKGRNTVGIVALVMAVIGFIFACVPGALIVGWILLPVSFILGLVGLFQKGKASWPAITAVIVSVVGTIVGVIVFLAFLGNAIDDAVSSTSAVSASVAPGGAAADAGGAGSADSSQGRTRENPYPLGTEISGKDWKVVINSVTFNANDAVAAANEFNDPPADGKEYVLINYTATYIGNEASGESPAFVSVDYVTPGGVTVDGTDSIAVAPDALDSLTTLYNGASVTGNIVRAVPIDGAQDGVLAVRPGLLADKVFVAVK